MNGGEREQEYEHGYADGGRDTRYAMLSEGFRKVEHAADAQQAGGDDLVNAKEIGHPTNRYLFKQMCDFFGIRLGECTIAQALEAVKDRAALSADGGDTKLLDWLIANDALVIGRDGEYIVTQPHHPGLLGGGIHKDPRAAIRAAIAAKQSRQGDEQ
ncbi:hypothetical protein [Pandoraea sp. SD6-2]|uniref:hypothetical protein n=1 Tax=Pandoraea sp. SD6-2 TaxID=1286093 RepID=UPI0011859838|nr:hypothetical protein [Pandoraea sp. SD6-2]